MTTMKRAQRPCQRSLFYLEEHDGFLNGAYLSPQLKAVHLAGVQALGLKNHPMLTQAADFFTLPAEVKKRFARLVDCPDPDRIALIPSVSYGMANVAKNVSLDKKQHILVAEGQFPSNYYSWAAKAEASGASLRIVPRPHRADNTTAAWNADLLAAINENTALVALSHIHWADGTLWDLAAIRQRTKEVGALLVLDGTQSVGALPFSVADIQPDALVCAGYKWLMGPYACGYAYYGPAFDTGQPIEENWINRENSHDFKQLVNYQDQYRPKAHRYCVGEHSNFVFLAMQQTALDQLLAWGPDYIQDYCADLWDHILPALEEMGIYLAEKRAHHLVGIQLPKGMKGDQLPAELQKRHLALSFRGESIRVSPNVYNRADEMTRLLDAFRAIR